MSTVNQGESSAASDQEEVEKRPPWRVLSVVLILTSLMVVGYGIASASGTLLLVELLLAAAALVVGGFLGFLFGIPRASPPSGATASAATAESEGQIAASSAGYQPSTNLEQVADWLTKILVGVGLVELADLQVRLATFGAAMAGTFQAPGVGIISQLVLIAFLVLGFITSFLWTRIYYGAIQTVADIDVRALLVRMTVTERRAKTAEQVSTALATGELKPATPAGRAAAAAAPEMRETDPVAALPEELRAPIGRLRDWSQFDWESDPNAELFEGAPRETNGRRLDAEILANLKNSALHIKLRVSRTPGGPPLEGPVLFLLHPTYSDRVEVAWPQNDAAEFQIISEGTFTVAAIADAGATVLSFDLARMPKAPRWFQEQ